MREPFWNIGDVRTLVHLLMAIPLLFLVYGVWLHFNLWRLGKKGKNLRQIWERMASFVLNVFLHRTILKDRYAGFMHLFIFWGFLILFLGTVAIFFQDSIVGRVFLVNFLRGRFYVFFKFMLDLSGVLVCVGTSMAVYRRYILKPSNLHSRREDAFILSLIFLIILSGFGLEGLRYSVTGPPESYWSPVGFVFGFVFEKMLLESSRLEFHHTLWWIHLGLAFFFVAYLPFSKLIHIFFSPLNIFLNSVNSSTALQPHDMASESFGVNRIKDFERNSLLAFDACTECGRCQDACPAWLSETTLNPQKVILRLQNQMRNGPRSLSNDRVSTDLIGNTVREEEIWTCTTCLNCIKECPVFIDPMKTILDLRRYLILTESRIPSEIERVYRNLEWFGDPWGMGKISRDGLGESIGVEAIGDNHPIDFLFWVGCQGYFHERNRKTISTLLRLFQRLKLRFAILGREEACCGDLARRTGNEYLFETIVKKNLDFLKSRGITKIVTHCPHCFNVFKNEYPQWGGKLPTFHYTELLKECFDKGLLPLQNDVFGRATFHDPCYLSRFNGIASEPRSLLRSIRHLEIIEMSRSKKTTFCCGAGGGGMWLGGQIGKRINEMRAEEALRTEADYLVTTCPYCLNMLEDGVKGLSKENILQVVDIVELLDRAVG